MSATLGFEGRVAIVTGAGHGLGRCHALELARRGAKVVVNDLGGAVDGTGPAAGAAQGVVAEIEALGGEAMANAANVADPEQVQAMVDEAVSRWGRVDILINNAGILRDKTFSKVTLDNFAAVMDVHVMGSVHCCKAVWPIMKAQKYGRIVMTTSSSGLYGNFGQTNYGAAKMAVVGLMNTLHLEGQKDDIRVNCIAPAAGTRMLEGLLPEAAFDLLAPESVTPGVVFLVSEDAPARTILTAGGGSFARTYIVETDGVFLEDADLNAESVAAQFEQVCDRTHERELQMGGEQTMKFVKTAALAKGVNLEIP